MNNQQVDLVQKLRGEQTDVVLERLVGVAQIVKGAVPQYLAQGAVLIDEFVQVVVVAVQIKTNHTAD